MSVCLTDLSSGGVWVNGDLAGASAVAVDCGCHFLPGEQCHDFLLGGNKLSGLGFLQRLANKMGKPFNLCTREQFFNPEKHPQRGIQWSRGFRRSWTCYEWRRVLLKWPRTFWGETWGSVRCLGWAERCSSCRSGDASGRDWKDCWGVGHDWFVWSADSKPHLLMTSSLDRSAGFPGWLEQGQRLPPSPAESWKFSQPHPAGWCNPFPFALGERDRDLHFISNCYLDVLLM